MKKNQGRTFLKALLAALLAGLLTAAFAQDIDPRGLALLEGLGDGGQPDQIRNVDMTITSVTYVEGEEFSSRSRTVIDYENERAAIISEVMGMETRMLLVDGQTRMSMMGMTMPLPPGTDSQFDSIFDQQTAASVVEGAQRITFDGPVNYGDLLVGDQVTYEGDASMYGTPESPVIHYVFNADGALLGMHMPAAEGEMIMVNKEPVHDMAMGYDMNVYMWDGSAWNLVQETTLESMEYNTELDESLFQ